MIQTTYCKQINILLQELIDTLEPGLVKNLRFLIF